MNEGRRLRPLVPTVLPPRWTNTLILNASEVWAFFHFNFSAATWLDSWAWSPATSISVCSCQVTPKSFLILKPFLEVDDPHIFSISSASHPLGDVLVFLLLSSGLERTGAFRSHLMSSLTAHPHHVTGNSTEAVVHCINKMFSYFPIICFFLRKPVCFFFLTLFFEKAVLFKIFLFAMIYEYKKGWGGGKIY